MKEVQKTTIGGSVGLAAFVGIVRYNFQDIPIMEMIEHAKGLGVNQLIDMVVPLVLGVTGLFYDEDKDA
jgi:hypothetical protein